ncbi:PTS lactose/cellobiose transporter subunit IIA [Caldifermentibacillus hisashii]|uniref:PTS lactose/cellobiose transporter subunit IIA n=1 Tax=Caldifermentibacillus hisashii TaxID=996558 RepID=UPI0031B79C7C
MEDLQIETVMNIIAYAGNAKSEGMEALQNAKKGDFEKAREHLESANKFLTEAHNLQTKLLTEEAGGKKFEVNLLTVHSQDHLMNTITFLDLVSEIISILEDK